MSREPLPEHLDLGRLAARGASLKGKIAAGAMRRLTESLLAVPDDAEVELNFQLDRVRRPVVSGSATTRVTLRCQRCLRAFEQPLEASFQLVAVSSETEGEQLPEGYEPLLVGEEPVRTDALVEDELILALPIVPLHAEGCEALPVAEPPPEDATAEQKPNPFAVLARLKRNED